MHGADWKGSLAKHLPLVDRVTDRYELNDLLAYMVSEVSSLHASVATGTFRTPDPQIDIGTLGARWSRDEAAGGYRLDRIYRSDPDFLERRGPLLRPGLGIKEGDVVLEINGVPTLSVADPAALLRDQANKQVLLKLRSGETEPYSRIVTPLPVAEASNLRYTDWEHTRRLLVDEKSKGEIGYAHIRAMGAENFAEFVRQAYAASDKAGLILDLRHNRGGNIDSWLLSRLMRKPWMWWQPRGESDPVPNMQNPFRGHLVVLVDAWTASDGETMANGVRHLGLGQSIGVRTWGGGIWLRGGINALVDRGFATAAEMGSFIPGEGWVIETHGFTPDVILDNNPARAFAGEDTQLDAAIKHLQALIAKDPKHKLPTPPPEPDLQPKKK